MAYSCVCHGNPFQMEIEDTIPPTDSLTLGKPPFICRLGTSLPSRVYLTWGDSARIQRVSSIIFQGIRRVLGRWLGLADTRGVLYCSETGWPDHHTLQQLSWGILSLPSLSPIKSLCCALGLLRCAAWGNGPKAGHIRPAASGSGARASLGLPMEEERQSPSEAPSNERSRMSRRRGVDLLGPMVIPPWTDHRSQNQTRNQGSAVGGFSIFSMKGPGGEGPDGSPW